MQTGTAALVQGSGGTMSGAPLGPSLLDLPEGVVRLLWRALRPTNGVPTDQHALRCTCMAMKQTTNGFIKNLRLNIKLSMPALHNQGQAEQNQQKMAALCVAACTQATQQLARFPSCATAAGFTLRVYCSNHSAMQQQDYHVLPSVLPAIFDQIRPTLAAVEQATLFGDVAITASELVALAVACPRLRQLEVSQTPVIGPAFLPLAHSAPHLRSLTCWGISTPHGCSALHTSVAALTQIRSFHLHSLSSRKLPSCAALAAHLLPHISSLHQLQDLRVSILVTDADHLHHFGALTALTSLHLTVRALSSGIHSQPPQPSVEQHITVLTSLRRLASLSIDASPLYDSSIQMLAALPSLTRLSADLRPSLDLSRLPCSWKQLSLGGGSAHFLPRLPLGGVERLCDIGLMWHLSSFDHHQGLVQTVSHVAQLVARLWDGALISFTADPPLDEQLTLGALSALAPLERLAAKKRLCLSFEVAPWSIGAAHAKALASALPHLGALFLHLLSPGLPEFVAALGTCWPHLRQLTIWAARADYMPDDVQSIGGALLEMADERTHRCWPLSVTFPAGLDIEAWEAIAKTWRGAGGQKEVVCFE